MSLNKKEYPAPYEKYINLIKADDVITALKENHQLILDFIEDIPREKMTYFYEENKWTVKQVLNHIIDTERILAYRALRFARGDGQMPNSFDENLFVKNANLKNTNAQILMDEFDAVRLSNILFYKQLSSIELQKMGETKKDKISVNAMGYFICGHALHHINVIKERYL